MTCSALQRWRGSSGEQIAVADFGLDGTGGGFLPVVPNKGSSRHLCRSARWNLILWIDIDFIQHKDLHKKANGLCCDNTKVNNSVEGRKGQISVEWECLPGISWPREARLEERVPAAGTGQKPQITWKKVLQSPARWAVTVCHPKERVWHVGGKGTTWIRKERCFIWVIRQEAWAYLSAFEF